MNRLHLLLTLTLSLIASGASAVEYTSKRCDNLGGLYCNGAASASCCGPTLSGATSGANLATGATDGSVTTTGSGGTMYGCVHPSATVPTQAQVIAGSSPCVDAQTKGSPSAGAVAFNSAGSNRFTGLSGSTEYAASYVHVDGTHRPVWQLRTSAPFTTLAGGGGGGSDLTGTGYFVDCDSGSDSNSGLSTAVPWKTLAKVNNNVTAAGSDVYLKRGSTCANQTVTIDWNGTASDRVIFGCYYLDAGNSNQPTSCDDGTDPIAVGDADMPQIDGTWDSACRAASSSSLNCAINTGSAVPSSIFQALVNVDADYVTVKNLALVDSAGEAIGGDGDNIGGTNSGLNGLIIDSVYADYAAFASVQLDDDVYHAAIRNSTFQNMAQCETMERSGVTITGGPYASCGASGGPGCVALTRTNDSYSVIEGNRVLHGRCEGINTSRSNYVWVRGNVVANTAPGIYGNHSGYNIIEHNIVLGDPGGSITNQHGIGFALEITGVGTEFEGGSFNLVRNNMVAGGDNCIWMNSLSTQAAAAGLKQGLYAYGNTCIGQESVSFLVTGSGAATSVDFFTAINNIVYSPTASTGDCSLSHIGTGTLSNNMYSSTPADTDCQGTGDVTGNPGFTLTESQFRALDFDDVPTLTFDDFRLPASGSNALNAGSLPTLPAWATTLLTDANWADVTAVGGGLTACDGTLNTTLADDAECATRDASPHLGALETTQ